MIVNRWDKSLDKQEDFVYCVNNKRGSKRYTLKKRRDFLYVKGGQFVSAPSFLLQGRPRNTPCDRIIRVGYTCSKKVGNSVNRNRAKRRLREAASQILPEFGCRGWDYVLIGKAKITQHRPFAELLQDLRDGVIKMHMDHEKK